MGTDIKQLFRKVTLKWRIGRTGAAKKQSGKVDCGATALWSIACYYGLHLPIESVREYCNTSLEGTNIAGIKEGAKKLHLKAIAQKVENVKNFICAIPFPEPSLLHLIKEDGSTHFVAMYKKVGEQYLIMDPAIGTLNYVWAKELNENLSGVFVAITKEPDFVAENRTLGFTQRILKIWKENKKVLTILLLLSALSTVVGATYSIFIQQIIDKVIPTANIPYMYGLTGVMGGIILGSIAISYFHSRLSTLCSTAMNRRLLATYIKKLFSLSQHFFDTHLNGDLSSRIADGFKINSFVCNKIQSLTICIFMLILSFTLMLWYNTHLTILALVWIPAYIAVYVCLDKKNRRLRRKSMESHSALQSVITDSIRCNKCIKLNRAENLIAKKITQSADKFFDNSLQLGFGVMHASIATNLITMVQSLVVLTIGTIYAASKVATAGELIAFYTLMAWFSAPISQLIDFNSTYTEAKAATERLYEILDLEPEEKDRFAGSKPKDGCSVERKWTDKKMGCYEGIFKNLTIRDMTFAHPQKAPILENASLTINRGEVVAITGESGCGKSTIAWLLMRLYRPTKGHLEINGIEDNEISLSNWRKIVAMVPQKPDILKGTLLENILLGCEIENADKHNSLLCKAIKLCQELGLQEYIESLPNGLLSVSGEYGANISGGQIQRIALAQALLREPEILILDEATSALDPQSEDMVKRVLLKFRDDGGTIIMTAHKRSILEIADSLYTIAHRKIVKQNGKEYKTESVSAKS